MSSTIQTTVLHRLGQVLLAYRLAAGQIGDGPRHLEDTSVAASGKSQAVSDHLQRFLTLFINLAELADVAGGHGGIGVQTVGAEAVALKLTGRFDPAANDSRGFPVAQVGEFPVRDSWYLDVQVNPVEQRSGNTLPIALDIVWCTST